MRISSGNLTIKTIDRRCMPYVLYMLYYGFMSLSVCLYNAGVDLLKQQGIHESHQGGK